jgi:L-threonylcarbamoyladenylate synthase
MQTQTLTLTPQNPDPALIAHAAAQLRAGHLVAFPTETVYGLGANALDPQAVRRIFTAKDRPAHDPLIVHLHTPQALPTVARHIPPLARKLAAHFWPGPLTLVLPRAPAIPPIVTAGGDTVAVRVPAHPVALALIQAAGVPVAAPSANRFGRLSPTRAEDVLADLAGRIAIILDAGPTPVGVESTVLSLATSPPTILRPGGVSREALEKHLGNIKVLTRPTAPEEPTSSPGTAIQHYAPQAEVILYQGPRDKVLSSLRTAAQALYQQGQRVGLLLADEDLPHFSGLPFIMRAVGSQHNLDDIARRLFVTLRALDDAEVTVILARDFGVRGVGLAIRDRLTRAAAGNVVHVD